MAISRNPISGNTSLLLLKLLSEKDMYGYEMIHSLAERSNNIFELKVGSLYPLLHSLVQSGYLKGYDREVSGKMRKYYQITANGQKNLERMAEERKTYTDTVNVMMGGV